MRPARPAAARRDRPGPRATAADGRAGCDEATRPATDRGAPSHRASRREIRGGRWSDARSWLVLNGKGVGALPAPPQGFDPAERREAQPVGGAGQRDIDPDKRAALAPDAVDPRVARRGRSEARRVGNEWGRTCRYRWQPYS